MKIKKAKTWFSFTGFELGSSILILLVIGIASYVNLQISFRKSRDSQRKLDIRNVYDGLVRFQHEFAYFPLSQNGKIVACGDGRKTPEGELVLVACEWGKDGLKDVSDPEYPAYLQTLPQDPYINQGVSYTYFSDGKRFELFAALEGKSEAEYSEDVIARNIKCGSSVCNYSLTSDQ